MSETHVSYTAEFEDLLKAESERAEAMSILHIRSHERFNKFSIGINIPVIVLSSLVGFLSPLSLFDGQTILLGGMSILIAIAKTVDSYMDFTKRTETHRVMSLSYSKISKYIQIQLSLEKECRVVARDLLDYISNDLSNLKDSEPIIPQIIIRDFNAKYGHEPTSKPAITNGLTIVRINKESATPRVEAPPSAFVPDEEAPLDLVLPAEPPKRRWKP
jgi:hypothetical protein